jgi:hypothetical protein
MNILAKWPRPTPASQRLHPCEGVGDAVVMWLSEAGSLVPQLLTPGVASIRLSQQWEADDGSGRGTPAIGFYVLRAGGGGELRYKSDCHFRTTATEYDRKPGIVVELWCEVTIGYNPRRARAHGDLPERGGRRQGVRDRRH